MQNWYSFQVNLTNVAIAFLMFAGFGYVMTRWLEKRINRALDERFARFVVPAPSIEEFLQRQLGAMHEDLRNLIVRMEEMERQMVRLKAQ